MRTLLWCGLVIALVAPHRVNAQHSSPRILLDAPSAEFTFGCRGIDPPNRTLPASVLSYEFTYGVRQPSPQVGAVQMEVHQRFTVVWDSVGRLVLFSAAHEPTESDSLGAAFILLPTFADTFAGRWFVLTDTAGNGPMTRDDVRAATALAALFWNRRCPRASAAPRAP